MKELARIIKFLSSNFFHLHFFQHFFYLFYYYFFKIFPLYLHVQVCLKWKIDLAWFFSSSSSSWDQASLISILIWGETNNEIESIGGKWREKWRDFVLSRIILCFFIIKNFYLCQRLTISQRQIFSHSTNWKLVYDCELNDHWRLT